MKRTIQFTLLMGLGLSIFSFCVKASTSTDDTPTDDTPKPPMPSAYYTDEEGRTEMTPEDAKLMGYLYDIANGTPQHLVPFSYKDLTQWNSVFDLPTKYNGSNLNSDIGMYPLNTGNKDLLGINANIRVYSSDGTSLTKSNYAKLLEPGKISSYIAVYMDSPITRDHGCTYSQVFFSFNGTDYFIKLPTVKITHIS